ncbi:FGGY family carbohydrate kinase [Sphingobacterium oryzagri]|uniref:FGGY family carbohydrate kinase n=1 Tax=Sphingobacterium oryzagri TaxID=3025669 RepID=A0ABY7WGJ4_9SPHI|nr:FGGY family carbohydrate kinase [Sphingobacterium sp. KACC 22765]WDF67405.1 FGGY family carbohydrate kinase [Sphingobacterium sp. KACC 22765]
MLLLGIDLGTSSIKVSIIDAGSKKRIVSKQYPETEAEILSVQQGWAEQDPKTWWSYTKTALAKANATGLYDPKDIKAIGIAYQMHGLVVVDQEQQPLRDAIIWCDSRAVDIGDEAMEVLQAKGFLASHLNSPGNFTASKLAWVRKHEPATYARIYKFMLPGDYLAMCLTGEINSNSSSLSEGVLWDFQQHALSDTLLNHYEIDKSLVPDLLPVFSTYGTILPQVADELGIARDAVVSYKAGDQPNNALSLNVFEPGEVAATAGTSGVIYAVTDQLLYDAHSRVNSFAHVNHQTGKPNIGVLLCINGTGIQNSWIKRMTANGLDYPQINEQAAHIPIGAAGVRVLPFGNGAERMFRNKTVHAHIEQLDFVRHTEAHLWRAAQEGIAFAFRYGLDILRENGLHPQVIKAGHANLFLSKVFQQSFAGATNVPVELYDNDGSVGAALGAGLGAGVFTDRKEAFSGMQHYATIEPTETALYDSLYADWKQSLERKLSTIS